MKSIQLKIHPCCVLIFFIFSLLFTVFVYSQESVPSAYYGHVSITIPIQPLSERGKEYFAKEGEVAWYGSISRTILSYSDTGHHGGAGIGIHQGYVTARTAFGDYSVIGSIDILSIFNFVPVAFKLLCRCIDINGRYYKQDKAKFLENTLYQVDKTRHAFYKNAQALNLQNAYAADIEYLQAKLYELEIEMMTCSGTKVLCEMQIRKCTIHCKDHYIL